MKSTSSRIRPLVCCDANFAVRYVTDRGAAQNQELWASWAEADATIVAPAIFRYEVTNAIHRLAAYTHLPDEGASELLESVLRLPVQIRDSPLQHSRALALSRALGLPATYDAHYLALANHKTVDLSRVTRSSTTPFTLV